MPDVSSMHGPSYCCFHMPLDNRKSKGNVSSGSRICCGCCRYSVYSLLLQNGIQLGQSILEQLIKNQLTKQLLRKGFQLCVNIFWERKNYSLAQVVQMGRVENSRREYRGSGKIKHCTKRRHPRGSSCLMAHLKKLFCHSDIRED